MARSLQKLKQIDTPLGYDDQRTGAEVSNTETTADDLEKVFHGMLSQLKRIIHGEDAGNWFDNINSVFGEDVSLKALLAKIGTGGGGGIDEDKILVERTTGLVMILRATGNVLVRR